MISNIDLLIRRETRRAIKAVLESSLSGDGSDEEKRRQDRQQSSIEKRDLKAHDGNPKSKDEAPEEEKEKKDVPKEEKKGKREDRTQGKGTADSPTLKTPKSDQLENPTIKSVVDKVNALRGGKSLNDPDVRKSFSQYFESLTVPERQSLLLFLTGIAQVLSGTEVGAEALDPGDAGLRVKDSEEVKQVKDKPEEKSKVGTESNPIVVGEVASKHAIRKVLKAYRDNS